MTFLASEWASFLQSTASQDVGTRVQARLISKLSLHSFRRGAPRSSYRRTTEDQGPGGGTQHHSYPRRREVCTTTPLLRVILVLMRPTRYDEFAKSALPYTCSQFLLSKADIGLGQADAKIDQVIIDCISKVNRISSPLQRQRY